MRTRGLKLRTGLGLIVAALTLLALVAAGLGWYGLQRSQAGLDHLQRVGVQANANVKNAYVNALLAVNQIDAAIKVDNPQQRARDLEAADGLLAASRRDLAAFLDAENLSGSNGSVVKQVLRETFGSYWEQATELRGHALAQDVSAYETLKRGQARNMARTVESAFKRFDTEIDRQGQAIIAQSSALSQQALYVFIGLLVIAAALALLSQAAVVRLVVHPLMRAMRVFDHFAAGDLTQRFDVSSRTEIGMLYVSIKKMQDSLSRIVGTVRNGMQSIAAGTQQIVAGNEDLNARTNQQAAALQQTAASMEQLASTVKQNADNARQANQMAAMASDVAQRGGEAVGEVVATMEGISDSSRKISDIVGVIDSIAFQTNILALNAAVEAARAGEQGKGFAVVASEVRALAQRSAQAAREIKVLIEDSVRKVSDGSGQVARAGATMQEIVASVARVTDIMGEISAATTEQASGIDEINHAIARMDEVTQHNAVLVQQAARAAGSLREQVETVTQAVAVFRTLDGGVIDMPVAMASLAGAAVHGTALATATDVAAPVSADVPVPRHSPAARSAASSVPARQAAPARASTRPAEDEWTEF